MVMLQWPIAKSCMPTCVGRGSGEKKPSTTTATTTATTAATTTTITRRKRNNSKVLIGINIVLLVLLASLLPIVDAKPPTPSEKDLTIHFDTEGLDRKIVMGHKVGNLSRVQVLDKELVVVSCKGQVFSTKGNALLGCGEVEPECGLSFGGCSFYGGTCVWDSDSGHVSKKPYCLRNGLCVPHGPGPSESDSLQLRESPHIFWNSPSGKHIVGGTVDAIVVLTQPQWGAYYHFLIDSLTRLHWMKEQYPEVVASDNTYFHIGMVNEVGQAWARLWGIDTSMESNRLLDGWWSSSKVYIPPFNNCAEDRRGADPIALHSFQASIQQHLPLVYSAPKPMQPTILMVRRMRTSTSRARVVTNWPALEKAVRKTFSTWKVEIFSDTPPLPTVSEVCKLFARASIVIGVHGAGFSNLICSRRRTILIELQQYPHSWDYQLLSMKLGLIYLGVGTAIPHLDPGSAPIPLVEKALGMALELAQAKGSDEEEAAAEEREIVQGLSLRVARVLVVVSSLALVASLLVVFGLSRRSRVASRPFGPAGAMAKSGQVIGLSEDSKYKYSAVDREES
mmetsp:Transcript_1675/g.3490  ORF Transcript_1675/g.3490 Transcript_1675/m.3490 type:complete len:564 (+) Transcript_1675:228-1919(+)